MEAPAWVCKELARVSPGVRLCWAGKPRQREDELNAGSFGLVRLYKTIHVGTPDEPLTAQEFWDATMRTDRFGRPEMRRITRGPIFSKKGGLSRDWDPLFWTPIYKVDFSGYDISTMDVMQGSEKLFGTIRSWMTNLKDRIVTSATTAEKELGRQVNDIARDGRDYLWHLANKTDSAGFRTTLKEERIAAEKKMKEKKPGFEGYYNPFKVFR